MIFANEVQSAFSALEPQFAFELRDVGAADSFGDAHAELHGDLLKVRVVRDRGQLFGSIGPRGSRDWFDLDLALCAVGAADTARQMIGGGQKSLAQLVQAVETHAQEFVAAFQQDNYAAFRQRVAEFSRDREFRPFAKP